jgi:hypothetical protein
MVGIRDYYGGRIAVATGNVNTSLLSLANGNINLTVTTPSDNDYDNQAPMTQVLTIVGANSVADPRVSATLSQSSNMLTPSGETNVYYGYTSMGTKVTWNTPTSSPSTWEYEYPESQILPQLYVTSGATTTESTSGGTLTAVSIVDATKLDSEIADYTAQNLIVVGGPCVNTVASKLLGDPATCTEGFTPGKSMVKLFTQANGNVAMLVAGYSGDDTRLAGRVVANRASDLTGTEVEIEGTTATDAKIGAPAPKVEAAAEEVVATE